MKMIKFGYYLSCGHDSVTVSLLDTEPSSYYMEGCTCRDKIPSSHTRSSMFSWSLASDIHIRYDFLPHSLQKSNIQQTTAYQVHTTLATSNLIMSNKRPLRQVDQFGDSLRQAIHHDTVAKIPMGAQLLMQWTRFPSRCDRDLAEGKCHAHSWRFDLDPAKGRHLA